MRRTDILSSTENLGNDLPSESLREKDIPIA